METDDKPTLLMVDDEPALLLSYKLILEQNGYQVSTAENSVRACELLLQDTFDLLVCDLGLERPNSGMEVLDFARAHHPDLPAVLLTGYPDDHISERARAVGVQILFKPVEVPKLLETLDFLLRRHRG
jgi:CheY-like chemotaxis protein